jgi:hypothetical protein
MTLANRAPYWRLGWQVCLLGLLLWGLPHPGWAELLQKAGRRYGPTVPGGYYVRVQPSTLTMSHTQRASMTVTVEDAAGQPVDDVLVSFVPSEGEVATGTSRTRGGEVTGTYTAATGSDAPRTAVVVVTVENVEATIFVDIVPAVFGR